MLAGLITGLLGKGLSDLAGSLFDTATEKTKELAVKKINEVTGLNLDFDTEPTEKELEILAKKEGKIIESLDGLKETNRHEEKMQALDIDETKIIIEDTKDARATDVARMTVGKTWLERNWTHLFSLFGTIFIFTLIYLIIFTTIPPENSKYADIVLGVLMSILGTIFAFYYGHSKSSGEKTEMLKEMKMSEGGTRWQRTDI